MLAMVKTTSRDRKKHNNLENATRDLLEEQSFTDCIK